MIHNESNFDRRTGFIFENVEKTDLILGSDDSCQIPNDVVLKDRTITATAICNQVFIVTCPVQSQNITWKINNETVAEVKNSYRISHVELKDEGRYSCAFTKGKKLTQLSMNLIVIKNNPYCGPPQNMKVSPAKRYSLRGEEVSWNCNAYVGEFWSESQFSLQFFAKERQGYFQLQNDSGNVMLNVMLQRNGILHGELKMNITKSSPREFMCRISNRGKFRAKKFFLVYGVSPKEKKAGIMRAFTLCLCASFAVFLLVCYWWNFRHSFNLLCIEYQRKTSSTLNDDRIHLEKLCIVHGQDVETWLFNYFLPTTESCIGYKCYLPIRDMKAGQNIIEEISLRIPKCERIFIIISKCLLKDDYSSLATRCAVRSAIGRRGKVICILFENFKKVQCQKPEDVNLLKALKSLSSVRYPLDRDTNPIPEEELKAIINLVIYVRGPKRVFNPSNQEEKFGYEVLKMGGVTLSGSCAVDIHTNSCTVDEPILYTLMEVKEYGKQMLWRLLWCQICLAFRGTSEQRFWFQILILLPSLSLPWRDKKKNKK